MNIIDTFVRYPFELFASSSLLGQSHSSTSTLKLHQVRALNAAQTQLSVNAAHGNVLIQDKQFKIDDDGVSLTVGMVWNSSDNTWRFSAETSALIQQEMISITEADGRVVQYSKKDNQYICSEPDQHGLTIVTIENGCCTRFFPDSGVKEVFNAAGKMTQQVLPTGMIVDYQYESNVLKSIVLPSQRQIKLDKEQSTIKLDLANPDNSVVAICAYQLEQSGSLTTTIPQPDGSQYHTQYTSQIIDGQCKLKITSDDQTTHELTFTQNGSIQSLREGAENEKNSRLWQFNRNAEQNKLSVSVNDQAMVEVGVDNAGHISRFKRTLDESECSFVCDAGGRVRKVTDKSGNVSENIFDEQTGLLLKGNDTPNGLAVEYTYHDDIHSPLFGVKLTSTVRDGEVKATTQYVYNDRRQCIFEISPEGRVQYCVYDDSEPYRLINKHKLPLFYPKDKVVNLVELNAWLATNPGYQFITTVYGYDKYGRKDSTRVVCGEKTLSAVNCQLDHFGRETQIKTLATVKDQKFDGLDRTILASDADKVAEFVYEKNKTTVKQNNGLVTEKYTDSCGQEADTVLQADKDKPAREASIARDVDGSIVGINKKDGSSSHNLFSKPGQVKFTLSTSDGVTEHLYDERDRLIGSVKYDITLDNTAKTIDQVVELTSACDRYFKTLAIKDNDDNIRFEVTIKKVLTAKGDEEWVGSVVEHQYRLGTRVATIQYANTISKDQFDKKDFSDLKCDADRVTRNVYDLDGNLLAEWVKVSNDGAGFYKLYDYNALGLRIAERIVLDKLPFTNDLNFKDIRTLNTRHWYDSAGRKIATLDTDNCLTAYVYNDKNQVAEKRVYAEAMPGIDRAAFTITLPEVNKQTDKIYTYGYDDFGREASIEESHSGLLVNKEYQNNGMLVIETKTDTHTGEKRVTQKQLNAFGEIVAEASARVSAGMKNDADRSKWANKIYHPVTGLLLQEINELNNKTIYFYGANRKPILKINAMGEVVRYQYDAISAKPVSVYAYYGRINAVALKKLQDDIYRTGFYDEAVMQSIVPAVHMNDRKESFQLNSDGSVNCHVKQSGGRDFQFNNAFGEVESTRLEVKKDEYRETQLKRDLRGNVVNKVVDPAGLAIETASKFDDALNRVTESTTESGHTVAVKYEGLRKQTLQDTADEKRKKILARDTFMRESSETDWQAGFTTNHQYNNTDRKHVVQNAVSADRNTSETKNAFGEVVETEVAGIKKEIKREVDGNVKSIINPDGSSESNKYNDAGFKEGTTSLLGLETIIENDLAGRLAKKRDQIPGKELVTSFDSNPFGEMDKMTDTMGLVVNHIQSDEVTETEVTDLANLFLIKQRVLNLAGQLVKYSIGDKKDIALYAEIIERDLVGNEEKRKIDLGNNQYAVIHNTRFDKSGHAIQVTNGKGDTTYHVYDKRGNERYTVDALGFVIEKIYDVNNRCIEEIRYANAVQSVDLDNLANTIVKNELDLSIKMIRDGDGLVRFELNGTAVVEHRYNGAGQRIDTIEYASVISVDQPTLASVTELVADPQYANHPLNRCKHVDYDVMGRKKLERDPEGKETLYRYDTAGNQVARVINGERSNYRIYDQFGNLRFKIDAEGYIKERRYNDVHVCTDKLAYSRKLSEYFSADEIGQLATLLNQEGITRQNDAILKDLIDKVTKLQLPEKDVHMEKLLDTAHRVTGNKDGENKVESYTLDGMGRVRERKDNRGNIWISHFNKANKLSQEISPVIDVAVISKNEATQQLTAEKLTTNVISEFKYDDAFNQNESILAANIDAEKRSQKTQHDQRQQIKETKIENAIFAKDGIEKQGDLTTTTFRDYAGRPLIEKAVNGGRDFTVYDQIGRKRFSVDAEGYVTEFRYQHAFGNESDVIHYEKTMMSDDFKNRQTALTLAEMHKFVDVHQHDKLNRKLSFTYNRNGQQKTVSKGKAYAARVYWENGKRFIVVKEFERLSTFDYNHFGERIAERKARMDGRPESILRHFYDKNGNEVATLSAQGYLTVHTFGMQNCRKDGAPYLEESSIQYFNPIPADKRGSLQEIMDAIVPDQLNDRHISRLYDRRHLCISTTIADGHEFFNTMRESDRSLKSKKENSKITTETAYDENGEPFMLTNAKGEKSYLVRNAVGDIEWEIGFPVEVSEGVTQIPVRQFLYNAHRQVVGSTIYYQPGKLEFDSNNRIKLDTLVTASSMDKTTLTLMCNRGLPLFTQENQRLSTKTLFNESRQPTLSRQFVTVPDKNDLLNVILKKVAREKSWAYNLRNDITMEGHKDEFDDVKAYFDINAFRERIGEGPAPDNFVLKQAFDNAGNNWFTDDEHGIATIKFFDEVDGDIVAIRSANHDLHDYLNMDNPYQSAKENLADPDYEAIFKECQQWVTYRNEDGQPERQDTPWMQSRPKYEPENYDVTFTVVKDTRPGKAGYMLRFNPPDEVFLKMFFKLRQKGSDNWKSIAIERMTEISGVEYCVIPLGDLPSNPYEYNLDFHLQNVEGEVSRLPNYRASGEVMLDTGNYSTATLPIWYMEGVDKLVIAGAAQNIYGVELLKDGQPIKRVAGTRLSDGKLRIDLAGIPSDLYSFRYVLGSANIADGLHLNQDGNSSVRLYHPTYAFNSASAISIGSNTFPLEFASQFRYKMLTATRAVPDGSIRNPKFKFYEIQDVRIYWGAPIVGANVSILDSSGYPRYSNQIIAKAPWRFGCLNDPNYNIPYAKLPLNSTPPVMSVKSADATHPHVLIVTSATQPGICMQLVEISKGQFMALTSGDLNSLPADATYSIASLASQDCSETISNIFIGADNENYFQPEEISITNFHIDTYSVGGYRRNTAICVDEYFAYEWNCSLGDEYPIHVVHTGVNADIINIKSMPLAAHENRVYFQQVSGVGKHYPPGPVALSLIKDGDVIPFTVSMAGHIQPINKGQQTIDDYNNSSVDRWAQMRVQYLHRSNYEDLHVLYFKKLPKGTDSITFEYTYTTSLGEKIWRTADCHLTQNGGLSVFTNNIPAGNYQCRILCRQGGKVVPVDNPRFRQDEKGYCYTTINITKREERYGQVFSNQKRDKILKVTKPFRMNNFDRWNNLRSTTDRKGNTIESDFNLLNQNIKTKLPAAENVAANGEHQKEQLVTEKRRNKLGHMVEQVDEAGDSKKFMPNQKGENLCVEDADGVQTEHGYDLFSNCLASRAAAYGLITSSFARVNELLVETRTYPNGSTEVITYNEVNHEIKMMGRIANKANDYHASFNHPDQQGRSRLTINPLSNAEGATQRKTSQRDFHPYSGAETREVNEDGREQSWSSQGGNAADIYVGNILKHTDLAGQTIVYQLNCNKQILSELGDITNVLKGARGQIDNQGTPPLPRNLRYLFDEAGRETDIIDDGAKLTTRKRYNKEDYSKEYYFISHDGHVYQATNTTYDELHRIHDICDTRILIEFGYDKKSNRRFAKAVLKDANGDVELCEGWYDYSPAGRVRFRDCVLDAINKYIKVDNGKGMEVAYQDGRVVAQHTKTVDGKAQTVIPQYGIGSAIKGVLTQTQGMPDKTETREPDAADRLVKRTVVTKDKSTTTTQVEEFVLDVDGSILSQKTTTIVEEDKKPTQKTETVRTIIEKSDLKLLEKVVTTVYEVIKGVNLIITDEVTTKYTAADNLSPGEVTCKRLPPVVDGKNPDGIIVDIDKESAKIKQARVVTRNNANGAIIGIGPDAPVEKGTFPDGYREFVVNSENCYLLKETKDGRNYYFYAEKRPGKTTLMAYFGDIPDSTERFVAATLPKVMNMDVNHQSFSSNFPPPYPGRCTADGVKTYRQIAEDLNYTGYADVLAWANNADADSVPSAGTEIRIPTLMAEVPETAYNGALPSIEMLLGSMYPALAMPHISVHPPKVNWALLVLEMAAAAAVTYMTAGALSGPAAAALGAHMGAAAAFGAAGVAGSLASQGVAIAAHQQQGLNVKAMATQGVASAVSGGILGGGSSATEAPVAEGFSWGDLAMNVATAEAVAAAQQATLMALGLQSKPDWQGFATAAFNGAAGTAIKANFGDGILAGGVYTAVTTAGDTLIRGQAINGDVLSASVVGGMLGSYAGQQGLAHIQTQQRPQTAAAPAHHSRAPGKNSSVNRNAPPKPAPSSSTSKDNWLADEYRRTHGYGYARNTAAFWQSRVNAEKSSPIATPASQSVFQNVAAYLDGMSTLEKVAIIGAGAVAGVLFLPETALAAIGTVLTASTAAVGVPVAEAVAVDTLAQVSLGLMLRGGVGAFAAEEGVNLLSKGGEGVASLVEDAPNVAAVEVESPYVVKPTLDSARKLKQFGLDASQRKAFYEGNQVIFEDPATSYPTATIFKCENDKLMAGIYDIISDEKGALMNFLSRSKSLAQSLGVEKLEVFGADIQNERLLSLLTRRGFEQGNPVLINAFGFNKQVSTVRKVYDLELQNQLSMKMW